MLAPFKTMPVCKGHEQEMRKIMVVGSLTGGHDFLRVNL